MHGCICVMVIWCEVCMVVFVLWLHGMSGVHGCICVMVTGCVRCAWLYLCNGYRVCAVCMVVFV